MKQFIKSILVLLIALNCGNLHAQKRNQVNIDSMLQEIPKSKADTNKVNFLNRLSYAYSSNATPGEGIKYGQQAMAMSKKLAWKKGIAQAANNLAFNYSALSEYSKALEYGHRALTTAQQTGDKYAQAWAMLNMGKADFSISKNIFAKKSRHAIKMAATRRTMAIYHLQQALALADVLHATDIEQDCYENLTEAYTLNGNDKKATESAGHLKALNETVSTKQSESVKQSEPAKQNEPKVTQTEKKEEHVPATSSQVAPPAGNAMMEEKEKTAEINLERQQSLTYMCLAGLLLLVGYAYFMVRKQGRSEQLRELAVNDKNRAISEKNIAENEKNTAKRERIAVENEKKKTDELLKKSGEQLVQSEELLKQFDDRLKKSDKLLKKSDALLLNMLPGKVITELKEKGEVAAKNYDDVTVLFTDFTNLAAMGELQAPMELINELHACFTAFDEITGKYKIEKIKNHGGAYLAVCGLPDANPKHAENIVGAAIEMAAFMKERYDNTDGKTFKMRIGINTGSVIAGILGVKKTAYDIWGDAVNSAMLMEQKSKLGRINISETTYELVKDKFDCEDRAEKKAGNKEQAKMYFVNVPKRI